MVCIKYILRRMYYSFCGRFSWVNDVKETPSGSKAEKNKGGGGLLLRAVGNSNVCFQVLIVIFQSSHFLFKLALVWIWGGCDSFEVRDKRTDQISSRKQAKPQWSCLPYTKRHGCVPSERAFPYSVCIRVAPDLAVDPGSGYHPVVFVLQPLRPVPAVNGWQQPSTRVANVDLGVLAAGGPDHGPAQRVILDVEGELAVVVVDFPDSGALIEVYGQQVPVMCLEAQSAKTKLKLDNYIDL